MGEIPAGWEVINRQFGMEYELLEKVTVEGYGSPIPAVLPLLKKHFVLLDGAQSEGIFRLAPDSEACKITKTAIDSGAFEDCSDANIIANLLKIFFRELPGSICSRFPERIIYQASEADLGGAYAKLMEIEDPWRSVMLWLLDVLALVVKNEEVNKMSCKNIATCISPNLFEVHITDNAMAAMTKTQTLVEFMTKILAARLKFHHDYTCKGV